MALLFYMIEGFGRRAPNLLRQARKASVIISEITSKGTALVAKQINIKM